MSRNYLALLCSCALLVAVAQAWPSRCAYDDENCRERQMHPDLPSSRASLAAVPGEDTQAFWIAKGKEFVAQKLSATLNTKRAKNVILFLGDGMGITTLAAARNLLGGEEQQLSFEKFPYSGLSKTYSVDQIVSDSACTATAYLTGVKAMYGTIGVNGRVERGDCVTVTDRSTHVDSIAKWAIDAGKSAGIVTTTAVTDASPAGAYAHTAERNWENDQEVAKTCGPNSKIDDIALQLLHGDVGSKLKVVLGGGKRHFVDSKLYANGVRADGRNLIDDFTKQSAKNKFVETREELLQTDAKTSERLLGLFRDGDFQYRMETSDGEQPTLEEMTRKAIEFMSTDANGYFLFIEGGLIDSAHHVNRARLSLNETVEFAKAIETARAMTSDEDTLIVVTADHSHTLSYSGYANRGSDIFGRAPALGADKKPYMTLSYANGDSFSQFYDETKHKRRDPTKVLTGAVNEQFPTTLPRSSETHSGEDVAVYASGPWAHLFTGVYEQNTIPHLMAYAACLGKGLKVCGT